MGANKNIILHSGNEFTNENNYLRMKRINITRALFILVTLLTFSNCSKTQDIIPNVYVDTYVYLTQPTSINLNAVGGWIYITGGVKGIVVYRKSPDEYVAFERNCPYKPQDNCAIAVESSNIIANDACCGSRFQLTDGLVIKGPSTRSLKQYIATLDNVNNVVHIYNY